MKISREAREMGKKLFRLCMDGEGNLDRERVTEGLKWLGDTKPRNYLQVAHHLAKSVELEIGRRTITVECATSLEDEGRSIFDEVEKTFGPALARNYTVNPDLLGGLRIQVGSDVWDGTVRTKLETLQKQIR